MTKVKPTTKEQLIFYLISNVNLGTYDKRFLVNLESMYLVSHRPLTTNQSDLLDKIIHRYSRQLAKLEINAFDMVNLPWNIPPVKSLPQFTETHLLLVDDELILRSPYKSAFVKDFKKLDIQAKWEHDGKFWRIPANTFTLHIVKSCIEKHYSTVNYCDSISSMLNAVVDLEKSPDWSPTYKYVNGNFFISAITEPLLNATESIEYKLDLITLSRLVAHGITIDSSVKEIFKEKYSDTEIEFASEFTTKVDLEDPALSKLLVSLNPDIVIFSEYISASRVYLSTVKNLVKGAGIPVSNITYANPIDISDYDYVILVESGISIKQQVLPYVSKAVQIVNSKPIPIK